MNYRLELQQAGPCLNKEIVKESLVETKKDSQSSPEEKIY